VAQKIPSSEITPERVYLNRRNFLRAALLAGSTGATAISYRFFRPGTPGGAEAGSAPGSPIAATPDPGDSLNTFEEITNYNNFYEFSTDKGNVAKEAKALVTQPWTVEVGGLVKRPRTFDLDELLRIDQEERVYRLRCVEAWSMVIPWTGFPLKKLLDQTEPLSSARYVAFQTLYDPERMLSSYSAGIDFPYLEGLRIDEAMHPLTILATGLYGRPMPNQNGAPLRLVVPWKYGFKSIKSVVKITLTDTEPKTTWSTYAPNWYGFYSNVNPDVNPVRWSQATERRIGELRQRKTLLFNGYADQVSSMYTGMDLKKYF
jgi:methionine sulfoxide reductase catalytic subunit